MHNENLKMLSSRLTQDACQSCGACCAFYRVSFYWAEAENLPENMVESLSPMYSCMAGTNQKQPRCLALQGEIGKQVSCQVYEQRSATCKEVEAGDAQCLKARRGLGLIPLIEIEITDPVNDEDYDQVS